MVLRALHLCSGYGGFELGMRLAGVPARTVAHVERDAYAASLLVARMEESLLDSAPIWSDLTTFDARPWAGRVDIVTAGFPCQPFSSAGQQRGIDDERWIWPHIARIIADVGCRLVFLENVPGLIRAGLPHVLADLANLGFDAEWGMYAAAEAGAPHKRERVWILAYTDSIRHGGQRLPIGGPPDGAEARGRGADVGNPGGEGRSEITGSTSSDEAAAPRTQGRRGGDEPHGSGEAMANTDGSGCPVERREQAEQCATDRRSGPPVSDTESVDGLHGRRLGVEQPERGRRRTGFGGEVVADSAGPRLQRRYGRESQVREPSRRAYPPPRDDADGWAEWIAEGGPEPALRRDADGRPPGLADALHAGGNGLLPSVAARALIELSHRAGLNLWPDA